MYRFLHLRSLPLMFCVAGLAIWSLTGCAGTAPIIEEPEMTVFAPAPDTVETGPISLETYAVRTVRSRSNVRMEPTTSSDVITQLDRGASVGLLAVREGWFHVVLDSAAGTTGWIWGPLLDLTREDRFGAALEIAKPRFGNDSLFVAAFYEDNFLKVSLDIAWRDMTAARKQEAVNQVGTAWRAAAQQLGLRPIPEVRFISNMNFEMARFTSKGQVVVKH